MAERYVNVDRDTPMLLPPDLREWVHDSAMVHLVLEAVRQGDLSTAHGSRRGTGDAQYPPSMMLALLIYCYSTQVFSSRRIERATYDSVSVRYLCGNTHPDHTTIAEFRRRNGPLLQHCFREVLLLARTMGLLQLGAVSLDGTRLPSAGSRRSVRQLHEIEAELADLAGTVDELLAQAEAADQAAPAVDGQLPPELASPSRRMAKLQAAKAEIERRRAQAAAEGRRRVPQSAHHTQTASVTEPESRRLRKGANGDAVQGYNAQAAVDAGQSQLIVGQLVSSEASDHYLLEPGVAAVVESVGTPTAVLVDKGYENFERLAAVEQRYGVSVLCPLRRQPLARAQTRHVTRQRQRTRALRQAMGERMREPEAAELYRRRRVTVEPVFGRLKETMGFRRFRCWGRAGASAEWALLCTAYNLRVLAAWRKSQR